MKKVRFESPVKAFKLTAMQDLECHSPRPFIERQIKTAPPINFSDFSPVTYTNDAVQRFDCSNASPYPGVRKTCLSNISKIDSRCLSSNELDLSILDSVYNGARQTSRPSNIPNTGHVKPLYNNFNTYSLGRNSSTQILTPLENRGISSSRPPNVLSKNDDFFLRRDNLNEIKNLHSPLNNLHLDKENNPLLQKTEIMKLGQINIQTKVPETFESSDTVVAKNIDCQCHHCVQLCNKKSISQYPIRVQRSNHYNVCPCVPIKPMKPMPLCPCNQEVSNHHPPCENRVVAPPQNAVDKKSWAIEKYEQCQKTTCLDLETQNSVSKEKREPTVADLFKIIKLQNEQLQLLQEKVDKFIATNKQETHISTQPVHNYLSEHVALDVATDNKISIGVMTSFEMVRTSTIINKETVVKQCEAQIQCNRSQISIKEVVSKTPVNLNFLDGITPLQINQAEGQRNSSGEACDNDIDNFHEDKTLNEMSLYNVQVDNAITPQLSPEQSLYLDIRDYSDSDASSDDQSNVGWTYYNKVMTHVNGMLHESDMPSSASALYRNAKQKCMQMQIDKTNISVAKRVTFGDDPLGAQQAQIRAPTTDTSLKMNQLAAKYLKHGPVTSNTPSPKPTSVPVDMSLATRNYMEKHNIIKGTNHHWPAPQVELPKFLDITALKKQPKLL